MGCRRENLTILVWVQTRGLTRGQTRGLTRGQTRELTRQVGEP